MERRMMLRSPRASIAGQAGSSAARSDAFSRFRSTRFQGILGFLVVSVALATALYAQSRDDEHRAKAAFVRNFGRFVEWPAESLPERSSLIVGFVGDDSFKDVLAEELRSKTANGHPIRLRPLRWNQQLTGCHILFVSASESKHLPSILQSISTESVLTISDLGRFAQLGGMIELVVVGDRVQFDINRHTALNARLKIDSKLLGAARRVYTGNSAVAP
jgi:hypothetical protein